MPAIAFRSPVAAKLHPHTAPVPPAGEFRVTQQFASPDYYWSNVPNPPDPLPTHNATDLGNRRCGDPILAMAPGIAYRIKDNATALGAATDALGVRIDHGYGIASEYWHLARQDVYDGQPVNAGFQIGLLGATGLGAVCHVHIEVKRNGVRIDPEPLMFGGSIDTEEDMRLPTALSSIVYGTLGAGNRIRTDPSTVEGAYVTTTTERVQVFGQVSRPEARWTIGNQSGDTWYFIGLGLDAGFVATALIPTLELTKLGTDHITTQGYTQAQLDAAKAEGAKVGFVDAKTKAAVAVQGIKP